MYEIKMPQMGQSVEEASIVTWFKSEGDRVAKGEPLFSIQTDKAEVECEAPESGVLRKILLQPDVLVPVLTVIGLIGEPDEPLPESVSAAASAAKAPQAAAEAAAAETVVIAASLPQREGGRVFVSPRAKAQAEALGIDPSLVTGTGPMGRVMEADVLAYAKQQESVRITPTARRVAAAGGVEVSRVTGTGIGGKITKADVLACGTPKLSGGTPKLSLGVAPPSEGNKRIPLTPMRRIIAKRMAESKFTAPHYYITVEIDMSAAVAFRTQCTAFTPSYNDLVLFTTVKTLCEFPAVNAKWLGDAIEQVGDINLGIAVALPGGLIVPVLKQAQHLSLEALCGATKELVEKARTGKLLPDDFAGNTFTVSNLGPFGVDHFTAIINQPDSAILAVGQMKDRPVVIDKGIHVRPIMNVTMSSDHRVVDGALAAQFMKRFKEILEAAAF